MRVEVLSGVERRRQWSDDEKGRIVEETLVPGARVAEVARRNAVSASLVFGWRRLARDGLLERFCLWRIRSRLKRRAAASAYGSQGEPDGAETALGRGVAALMAVEIVATAPARPASAPPAASRPRRSAGLIEIELSQGRRLRVGRDVDGDALRRVLDVLDRR